MWQLLATSAAARIAGIIAFPVACVVGTLGYYMEQHYFAKKNEIPYLEKSLIQQRNERLMAEEYKAQTTT